MEQAPSAPPLPRPSRRSAALLALLLIATTAARADTLANVRSTGRLVYGSDEEGGAPYLYQDRNPPHARIGFEAELMDRVARELNVTPVFKQALWENLLQVLARGEIDVVVNGYELTERRARDYLATRPYYLFQLQLLALPGGPVHALADFGLPKPGGGVWQLGVLGNSAADVYAQRLDPRLVRVVRFDGATNAMMKVRSGQIDATLQDLPAALHYVRQPEFKDLVLAGPPEGCGYYVMYVRKGDEALRDALDDAIGKVVRSGEWKTICAKYHIWNDAQTVLADWKAHGPRRADDPSGPGSTGTCSATSSPTCCSRPA